MLNSSNILYFLKRLKIDRIFILFIILTFIAIYLYIFIQQSQAKEENYFYHNEKLGNMINIDKSMDDFLRIDLRLVNFDEISAQTDEFSKSLEFLKTQAIKFELPQSYSDKLDIVDATFEEKRLNIERFKARRAFVSNALNYFLDTQDIGYTSLSDNQKLIVDKFRFEIINDFYTNQQISNNIQKLTYLKELENTEIEYIKNLLRVYGAFDNNLQTMNLLIRDNNKLNLEQKLYNAKNELLLMASYERFNSSNIVNIIFLSLCLFFLLLALFYMKIQAIKKELSAFKIAVENSSNVVVLTNKDKNIIFVNEMFEKTTGYTKNEAFGLNTRILKSGLLDSSFYKELNDTLDSGNKWRGQFTNKDKDGNIFYEDATISPIIIDGEVDGYLAIKLDITDKIKYTKELESLNENLEIKVQEALANIREKDFALMQQSKMASMGEMIANIAHQWRQPLSAITSSASGIRVNSEFGILDDESLFKSIDMIMKNANYLSNTIENFRNFFNPNQERKSFYADELINQTIDIFGTSFSSHNITIVKDLEHIQITSYANGIQQIVLNIIKNSIEAIDKDGLIIIKTMHDEDFLFIFIQDSGGGIDESIKDKIFEPYFTTKHKSIGTGIGLNMSYQIAKEHLKGALEVICKQSYEYQGKTYQGAKFILKVPL